MFWRWTEPDDRQLARRRARRSRNQAHYLAGQASEARTGAMLHLMRTQELLWKQTSS